MSYKVQPGDTFWLISQKTHISVEALQAANPGVAVNGLQVGQNLTIPNKNTIVTFKYTIRLGDTFYSIAQTYGLPVQALESANPGVNGTTLQIGQVINVISDSNGYVPYSGPASNFPDPKYWASWDKLWTENERFLKLHDSDSEVTDIKNAINQVSKESGVDARVILCIIVQESGGDVRVKTTNNGVRNPGLMQSHDGVEFSPSDPAGSILQMIRDGVEGTKDGPGIGQLHAKYGNYYSAFRAYNSGSIDVKDLNDPVGATATYVQSAANRLMGHVWKNM